MSTSTDSNYIYAGAGIRAACVTPNHHQHPIAQVACSKSQAPEEAELAEVGEVVGEGGRSGNRVGMRLRGCGMHNGGMNITGGGTDEKW